MKRWQTLGVLLLLLLPMKAGAKDASGDPSPTENTSSLWINLGMGPGLGEMSFAGHGSINLRFLDYQLLSLGGSTMSTCGFLCSRSTHVGVSSLSWGLLANGAKGYAGISLGPSFTDVRKAKNQFMKGVESTKASESVYGLNVTSQLFLRPMRLFGIGLIIDCNFNEVQNAAAMIIALQTRSPE